MSVALGEYMTAVNTTDQWGSRKTAVFTIIDRHGGALGVVRWYGAWRQYCFFPEGAPVFNNDCLNRISAFMALCTKRQRDGRQER
ncbi:MAG: hypothetical protein HY323_08215 [Betaproteobacteria bacterium]|nr:hypothetical protein [Betaproteobacteria bacterium]